jgi:hypothetical protein
MLNLDWIINTLKEAIEEKNWDLVKEIIIYLEEDDVFEQYKEDEDWWKGEDN